MTKANRQSELPTLTTQRLLLLGGGGVLAVILVAGLCSLFGPAELSAEIWWSIRIKRILLAMLVGGSLSVGGMALQGMLRNPLAEPYLLGISSGAGVGVLLGIVWTTFLPSWMNSTVLAFAGGMATCLTVYLIAQRNGRLDNVTLILAGVVVNAFNGAIMLSIYLQAEPSQIADFSRWMMGSIHLGASPFIIWLAAGCIVLGWITIFLEAARFNVLGLGEQVARSSGVSVGRLRLVTFAFVSLMTAAAVMLAGPIGFVGLIVPHLCRVIFRADFRVLLLVSGFAGAIFLMIAETVCYVLPNYINVGAVPVGIATAFLGGPFFLYLLRRRGRAVSL